MDWFKFTQQYGPRQRTRAERRITKTGEAYEERTAYRQRGELSPGEPELVRMIRDELANGIHSRKTK